MYFPAYEIRSCGMAGDAPAADRRSGAKAGVTLIMCDEKALETAVALSGAPASGSA